MGLKSYMNDVKQVNILGTEYRVCEKKYLQEPEFAARQINGYCNWPEKQIVYCDMQTYPGYEMEGSAHLDILEKQILRHEIVHAFLFESGLGYSSATVDSWATNEEMVDWLAYQLPKIKKACEELDVF